METEPGFMDRSGAGELRELLLELTGGKDGAAGSSRTRANRFGRSARRFSSTESGRMEALSSHQRTQRMLGKGTEADA